MRLIDADELLKQIDAERKYLIKRGQTGAEHILVHNFRDLILNAPTIESNKWNLYSEKLSKVDKDVLNKIRTEITTIAINGQIDEHTAFVRTAEQIKQMVLDIIDKYKAENEE